MAKANSKIHGSYAPRFGPVRHDTAMHGLLYSLPIAALLWTPIIWGVSKLL